MSQDGKVYDLGNVRLDADPPRTPARPRAVSAQGKVVTASRWDPGASAVAGSLSLFAPGCGQLVVGEIAPGLFFLTGVGLCGALLWAIASSVERIVPTLALLGVGPTAVAVTAIGTFVAAALLHVTAVLHAARLDDDAGMGRLPHPVTAGLASLVMPGWGQLLAGHERRTALFLFTSWAAAGAWAVVSPPVARTLPALGLALPAWVRDGFGPVALIAVPVLVWVLAVYDAAAGAAMERGGSR